MLNTPGFSQGTNTYSVVVVDDDPRLREGFVRAIQASHDLRLVGEAGDFPEALALLESLRPEVLLVDIGLPNGSGLELIRYAAKHIPHCNIMVVTIFAEEKLVMDCIEAGADGYLLKDANNDDIAEQIHVLLEGGSPLTPSIARRLLKRFAGQAVTVEGKSELSSQELLVLQMSAKGYTYDEIAKMLNLSRHTIGTYVKRTYQKLQVHSKSEAVFEARKLGLAIE